MSNEQSPEHGSRTTEIARLNDEFRRSTQQVMITPGVQTLPDVLGLIRTVRVFDTFTPDNDPWGEHDYGSIVWYGDKTLWKIDYYDQALEYWCDPLVVVDPHFGPNQGIDSWITVCGSRFQVGTNLTPCM